MYYWPDEVKVFIRKLAFFLNSSARDPILLGVQKDPS